MTQAEILKLVRSDESLIDRLAAELNYRKIKWSKSEPKVGGKKVGRHRFDNAVKLAAVYVYDNRMTEISAGLAAAQLTMF